MFAYIIGKITHKSPTDIYLETNGVGYHLHISLNTYSDIEPLNEVKLFTHFHVKEDAQTLYGFSSNEEKNIFQLLISVSGVGPNTARIVLSALKPKEVQKAIVHEDVLSFNKVKGIGPKTAKRIILDLKDKVIKNVDEQLISSGPNHNTDRNEALSALIALGFPKASIEKMLDKVISGSESDLNVEQLIKEVLKQLR
ncbi:Holliday junction branch migration protein RuvA [Portibacter lacus]|uniref:Holliday junction branch migration complex subunit RuvA n=1 Tax=Portibacter lacus TaxID=1099794 RepID=A0AA37SLV8_9BACT|nr:Holliday junction branch migration protein RuvA [Portibacter lacus]GLR16898.1 Holliday junction ATP-dependent DNA helicase RuvA [Portibacter lacus]